MDKRIGLQRLREFIGDMTVLVCEAKTDEARILAEGSGLLNRLIAFDDWLPERFARADPKYYQQYLLYCDPLCRFSVVSFVWGAGQSTPIHDHTTWGLIGMLRGAEISQAYSLVGGIPVPDEKERLDAGQVACVSPSVGDIHSVSNAFADRSSISVHVYGGNIGAISRHVFDERGNVKQFISGYGNDVLPNVWAA